MWFDSHCHLQDEYISNQDGLNETISNARLAGVTGMVCVGTDEKTSTQAIEIAKSHDGIWASIGLHPHQASEEDGWIEPLIDYLEDAQRIKLVGIGECGLDYFYEHSPREIQQKSFARQIGIAKKYDLTLIVHTRDAWEDTLAILGQEGTPSRCIIHCFTGGPREAELCLELGAWLSFSGIVTFNKAKDVQDAARLCPIDRMLVETDSPFLAPVPHRGKSNQPKWVIEVGEFLASLKGLDPTELARCTSQNARRAYGIDGS